MINIERVQDTNQVGGPHDNLQAVNQVSLGTFEPGMREEALTIPTIKTECTSPLLPDATSLEDIDEAEYRPVPLKDMQQYLFLAEELKGERERKHQAERMQFWSEQVSRELGLEQKTTSTESSAGADYSPLVQPAAVRKILEMCDISLADWQAVTASANVADLLRAARSVQALEVGLPKDATDADIEARKKDIRADRGFEAALADKDYVNWVSENMRRISARPEKHTSALNKDGSVELGEYSIVLDSWYSSKLPKEPDHFGPSTVNRALAVGSAVTVAAAVALGLAGGPPTFIFGASALNFVMGALIGGLMPPLDYHYLRLPAARRRLLGHLTNNPSLQRTIRELEVRGVRCETSLDKDRHDQDCLKLRFYIPKKR